MKGYIPTPLPVRYYLYFKVANLQLPRSVARFRLRRVAVSTTGHQVGAKIPVTATEKLRQSGLGYRLGQLQIKLE
ncbi:MAG: hypothetical protein PHP50_12660 [Lachnospiraceae bacterium]|nr:hypothetical protein [Lachnospiraceae bacterium]